MGLVLPSVETGVSHGRGPGRIMRLCGWKTRVIFDSYNITNQEDLNEAVAPVDRHRQVNGKQAANKLKAAVCWTSKMPHYEKPTL